MTEFEDENGEPVSLEDTAALGAEAQELLDNDLLQRSFAALEERYTDVWRQSTPSDAESREGAYFALRALKRLQKDLTITVENGGLAAKALANDNAEEN